MSPRPTRPPPLGSPISSRGRTSTIPCLSMGCRIVNSCGTLLDTSLLVNLLHLWANLVWEKLRSCDAYRYCCGHWRSVCEWTGLAGGFSVAVVRLLLLLSCSFYSCLSIDCYFSGYCQQMDTHVPFSTVCEALLFSAKLRQPRSGS